MGGHSGYVADLDGHLWELVYVSSTALMQTDRDGVDAALFCCFTRNLVKQ